MRQIGCTLAGLGPMQLIDCDLAALQVDATVVDVALLLWISSISMTFHAGLKRVEFEMKSGMLGWRSC